MSVIRKPLPSRKAWHWWFPLRRRKLLSNRDNELVNGVVAAIKECLETTKGLLDTNPLPTDIGPQIVAVTIPAKNEDLRRIEHHVREIVKREGWWQKHATITNFSFGFVNFPDLVVNQVPQVLETKQGLAKFVSNVGRFLWETLTWIPGTAHRLVFGRDHKQSKLYVTVTRLFLEKGPIHHIQEILHPGTTPIGTSQVLGWGFGTLRHTMRANSLPQNGHAQVNGHAPIPVGSESTNTRRGEVSDERDLTLSRDEDMENKKVVEIGSSTAP